ncbi:hypothetical protein [Neisseria sicca]|nr:hypothetical protein [Neisseria sicca]
MKSERSSENRFRFSDDLFSNIFRLFDGKNDCLQETYICAAAGRVQV